MKTEARKAYEKQMPRWEMLLRDRIRNEKHILEEWKCELADALEYAKRENTGVYSEGNLRCIKENLEFIREAIHAQKKLIQILKSGLPQRRPAGVMAKCPHCGAKQFQSDIIHIKNGNRVYKVNVPALSAFDYKDRAVVIAECNKCGAVFKLSNKTHTVQDAIDAWNRRK